MRKKTSLLQPHNTVIGICWSVIALLRSVVAALLGGDICVRCGSASGVFPLCPSCLRSFVQFPLCADESVARCRICGKALVSELELCSVCRNEPVLKSTERVVPLHAYRLWKKSVLFAWKSEDKRTLSPVFAQMVFNAYAELCRTCETKLVVVPVPPRPGKIKQRGWDQVDELCRFLHRGWHVPVVKVLRRQSRVQQKKLGRARRLDRAEASYQLADETWIRRHLPVIPQAAVLIDDVLTTGATIEACAKRLKSLGIAQVFAITLFVVD